LHNFGSDPEQAVDENLGIMKVCSLIQYNIIGVVIIECAVKSSGWIIIVQLLTCHVLQVQQWIAVDSWCGCHVIVLGVCTTAWRPTK